MGMEGDGATRVRKWRKISGASVSVRSFTITGDGDTCTLSNTYDDPEHNGHRARREENAQEGPDRFPPPQLH